MNPGKLLCAMTMVMSMTMLQGCLNVATSGAQAVYNRHGIEKNIDDQMMTMQVYKALYIDTDKFKNTNISISTYNGEVLLAGQVPDAERKASAEKIARQVTKAKYVYNLIAIQSPSSTLTRISDGWITSKVKAKLIASQDVDGSQVKVVTENGVVFLMGILPPEQASAAVDLASNTDGVLSVVKVFTYLKMTKSLA